MEILLAVAVAGIIAIVVAIVLVVGAILKSPRLEGTRDSDDPHRINIKQEPPEGFRRKEMDVPVAGVTFRKNEVEDFILSRTRRVFLERELDNRADKNAIKVIGGWDGVRGPQRKQLGYLPKGMGANLPDGPLAATLVTMFESTEGDGDEGRNAGLRIDVWIPLSEPQQRSSRQQASTPPPPKPPPMPAHPPPTGPSKPVPGKVETPAQEAQGLVDQIESLAVLLAKGQLSEREFEDAKARLLGMESKSQREELGRIAALHARGALTDAEFELARARIVSAS